MQARKVPAVGDSFSSPLPVVVVWWRGLRSNSIWKGGGGGTRDTASEALIRPSERLAIDDVDIPERERERVESARRTPL